MQRILTALAIFFSTLAWAAVPPWAITNARIVIAPGRTINRGTILLRDSLIQAAGETIAIPPDALIYDANGLTVCAGWIDGSTYFGFPLPATPTPPARRGAVPADINSPERYLAPISAGVLADISAALKMTVPSQPDPRRNLGFTTLLSVPREGLWQGSSALVNLTGETAADMIVRSPVAMHVSFATRRGTYPSSLMGAFAILRQSLITADQYREALALYQHMGGRGVTRPRHDPVSAALLPVLDGKLPVVFKADTAEQIRRAIRFSDEFKIKPVIYSGAEAWRVAGLLKARGIPVLVDLALKVPTAPRGLFGEEEAAEEEPPNSPKLFAVESNPGRLEKAGVHFAFASAALDRPEQILSQIRTAIARGLSAGAALAALTTVPAEIFGAASQLGSIEPGKIANVTLLDGEPFAEKTNAKAVVIDGRFYYPPASAPSGPPAPRMAAGRTPTPPSSIAPERRPPEPEPQARDLVIRNATILTVTNGSIENGSIWVHEGKIKEVGKSVSSPADALAIDATGQYVMPGIIDSHSHTAINGGVNEGGPAISPQARIADVLDPEDIDLYRALAGGVTTLNILHGSANAIGGQNAVIKIKWSRPMDEMLFLGAPRGIKMALGENPKRSNFSGPTPRFPATRMGVESVIRESLTRAREYARAWEDYRARSARGEVLLPPVRNLVLEALADVLAGRILVHAHCYRADEISMLLDLADEFGFKIRSLQHVTEGYKVTEKIRRHGAGASTFADFWGYKMEAWDGTAYNAALMVKAGIRTAVNSDDNERARRLYAEAAKCMKYGGLSETQALRLITLDPAWMLGIDNRVGSIEPGKDADLTIFSGHPFSPYSRVEKTIIDGQVFFDRSRDLAQRIPWKEEFEPELERAGHRQRASAITIAGRLSVNKPAALATLWLAPLFGQTYIITNARIVPVSATPIEHGSLLLKDGTIAAMGTQLKPPAGAKKIDGTGLTVYPGLIDGYTNLGLAEIESVKGSVDTTELGVDNPQAQAWIAVNPHSEMIRTARINGVTSALVVPTGNRIAGSAAAINLMGRYPDQMLLRARVGLVLNIPSVHRRARRDLGGSDPVAPPETEEQRRQRVADEMAKLKQFLREAKAYAGMKARLASSGAGNGETRDATQEAMVPAIRGECAVICPADHFRDIRSAVELGTEFGLKVIIAGGAEAAKVADLLKKNNVPVLFAAVNSLPRSAEDPYDINFATPEILRRVGVKFAIVSNSAEDSRNLPYLAAMTAAYGLESDDALKAITMWPAEVLGISDKVGSIEPGKMANLLITRGDSLDIRSEIKYVFIEGKLVDLESRNTELYERFRR
jgi:imidazolonepropionase-like amidohydrolase